jgi:hypothetical protein
MLIAMEGTYKYGQIVLKHPLKTTVKTKAMVIFEEEKAENSKSKDKRPFGISRGAFTMSPDFDEPMEDLEDYM